jgi:hypothetical protein
MSFFAAYRALTPVDPIGLQAVNFNFRTDPFDRRSLGDLEIALEERSKSGGKTPQVMHTRLLDARVHVPK